MEYKKEKAKNDINNKAENMYIFTLWGYKGISYVGSQ